MMEHITVTTQNTDFHSDISEVIGVRIEMDSGDLAIESLKFSNPSLLTINNLHRKS